MKKTLHAVALSATALSVPAWAQGNAGPNRRIARGLRLQGRCSYNAQYRGLVERLTAGAASRAFDRSGNGYALADRNCHYDQPAGDSRWRQISLLASVQNPSGRTYVGPASVVAGIKSRL